MHPKKCSLPTKNLSFINPGDKEKTGLCLKLTLGFSVTTLEIAGLEEDVDATTSATTTIAPCATTVGADVACTHKVVRTDPD